MKKIIIFPLLSLLVLSGCAQTPMDYKSGTEVTSAQLAQFIPGKTAQSDVIAAIGQPNKKEALNSKELWYYDYSRIGALGGNTSESTVFEWDSKGKLLQAYKAGKSGKSGNALLDAANGR